MQLVQRTGEQGMLGDPLRNGGVLLRSFRRTLHAEPHREVVTQQRAINYSAIGVSMARKIPQLGHRNANQDPVDA